MSITFFVITSLILILFVFNAVAVVVDPPRCTDFPAGCTCTTQNTTITDGITGEVSYGVFVVTVTCKGVGLTEVPDFTNHTRVETIDLQRNSIRKIRRKDFAMLSHLTSLDLSYNLIDDIEVDSFSSTILQNLFLVHNQLKTLPPHFFDQPKRLTLLELSYNNFTKVPSNFLHNTADILSLHLSHNPIGGSLRRFTFVRNNSVSRLEDLFLINCSIYDIEKGAFYGLDELRTLHLDHNNLRSLRQDMLEHLPSSVQELSATYNKIESIDGDTFENMRRLANLILDYNNITRIEAKTFKNMDSFEFLSIQDNQISRIAKKAFTGSRIKYLYLSWNRINSFHPETFKGQDRLVEILLTGNRLVTINPEVFSDDHIMNLQVLELGYNELVEFPRIRNNKLTYYHLESNNLTYADHDVFAGVPNVEILKLSYNALRMHNDSLKPLKWLREFIMQGNHLFTHLPSLENNPSLKSIDVEHCNLKELPEDICDTCPRLRILSVYSNYLTRIPKLNCTNLDSLSLSYNEIESLDNLPFEGLYYLQILELYHNRITSLPSDVFKDLYSLRDLFIEHNSISRIPLKTFQSTPNMEFLDLSNNPVRELQDRVFHELDLVLELYLGDMGIQRIAKNAFPENMSHLLLLDLHNNDFDYLPIPKGGWPELRYLYLYGIPSLYRAPVPKDCPRLQGAVFTYTYHCCAFESFSPSDWHKPSNPYVPPIIKLPSRISDIEHEPTTSPDTKGTNASYVCEFYKEKFNITTFCEIDETAPDIPIINRTEIEIIRLLAVASIPPNNSFACYPRADPMAPCEDLLGSWALRVLIWVVFVVTLFGNGLVLTVILASPKPPRRLGPPIVDRKVSQFYISQLAVADIGIGIYLGFLAVVDLKTFGKQDFYQMALSWQYGPGCLTAGFIAILSSELSVYILVIITLERLYVYKRAMIATKMHMCNAILIILFGWIFAGVCATLPLIGYNSYTTVAICLPFDVVSTEGKYYIAFVMGINLLAFIIVAACNLYLYCRLGKISSITASDSKMFRMVFVLIITDFICWAPLVIISLAALFRQDLIRTNHFKWFAVLVLPINACANPFLYGLLTEKFKHQMQGMCHSAKRLLPGHRASGIRPQQLHSRRNSISLGEIHRPSYTSSIGIPTFSSSLGQNSPGSMSSSSISSSSAPFLGRRASLPTLGTDGLRIGSPRGMIRFLPTPLNDSMPELTSNESSEPYYPLSYPRFMLEKPIAKTKLTLATVKEQATVPVKNQPVSEYGVETEEEMIAIAEIKKSGEDTAFHKISPRVHHNSDERSGTDSPSLGIGSSVQGTDEDSHSITSLCLDPSSTLNNNNHPVMCVFEETDV